MCKKFDSLKKSQQKQQQAIHCIVRVSHHIWQGGDEQQQRGRVVHAFIKGQNLRRVEKKGWGGEMLAGKKGFIDDDSENRGEYEERIFLLPPKRRRGQGFGNCVRATQSRCRVFKIWLIAFEKFNWNSLKSVKICFSRNNYKMTSAKSTPEMAFVILVSEIKIHFRLVPLPKGVRRGFLF